MVRGLENIVKGRNPKDVWAFVQRTCGVCTTTHAITSIRAVEDALKITVPPNAEMVRNIMLGHCICTIMWFIFIIFTLLIG
jgi:hydrogenase large subunit